MLQSWMRVPRSAPNYPRSSKWINMGIWGSETCVPGDHTIATISQGWMNNSRKGMSTDKKDIGKRSSLVTSKPMVHKNRHVHRWSIILADHLYDKNNVPYLVMDRVKQKICSKKKIAIKLGFTVCISWKSPGSVYLFYWSNTCICCCYKATIVFIQHSIWISFTTWIPSTLS
jgi:hypothetical protein